MGGQSGKTSEVPGAPGYSWSWVQKELDKKANREWVESELAALTKDEDETRKIALSGKRKAEMPHECLKEDTLDKLVKHVDGWKSFKLGSAIALIVLIGGAVAQFFALKAQADNTDKAVEEVTTSVKGIRSDVKEIGDAMEEHLDWTEQQEKGKQAQEDRQIRAISDAVKIAIEESTVKKKKK